MYSTCIFCHASLDSNEVIERFPIGRRIAFDPSKGRLWVICRRCNRWNLTPLEERWEAIEDCEKRFRTAKARVSSGEIGLCRLSEGLSLVRIGRPLLPEMAAWRYGRQLTRRWKQRVAVGAVGVPLSLAGLMLSHILLPDSPFVAQGISQLPSMWMLHFAFSEDPLRPWRALAPFRLRLDHVGVPGIHRVWWNQSTLLRSPSPLEPWRLSLEYNALGDNWSGPTRRLEVAGAEGVGLARQVLAQINAAGGRNSLVARATARLEAKGSPMELFRSSAGRFSHGRHLVSMERDQRLALEMAANDELERRAMEGELRMLEDEWRAAEEIANIADNMFLLASVETFLRRHRITTSNG